MAEEFGALKIDRHKGWPTLGAILVLVLIILIVMMAIYYLA